MFSHAAAKRKIVRQLVPASAPAANTPGDGLTIRRSAPGDAPQLSRLARLDDRRLAKGPYVVAERSGEIVAAKPLGAGATIANPFIFTADFVDLIDVRARQLLT